MKIEAFSLSAGSVMALFIHFRQEIPFAIFVNNVKLFQKKGVSARA